MFAILSYIWQKGIFYNILLLLKALTLKIFSLILMYEIYVFCSNTGWMGRNIRKQLGFLKLYENYLNELIEHEDIYFTNIQLSHEIFIQNLFDYNGLLLLLRVCRYYMMITHSLWKIKSHLT